MISVHIFPLSLIKRRKYFYLGRKLNQLFLFLWLLWTFIEINIWREAGQHTFPLMMTRNVYRQGRELCDWFIWNRGNYLPAISHMFLHERIRTTHSWDLSQHSPPLYKICMLFVVQPCSSLVWSPRKIINIGADDGYTTFSLQSLSLSSGSLSYFIYLYHHQTEPGDIVMVS